MHNSRRQTILGLDNYRDSQIFGDQFDQVRLAKILSDLESSCHSNERDIVSFTLQNLETIIEEKLSEDFKQLEGPAMTPDEMTHRRLSLENSVLKCLGVEAKKQMGMLIANLKKGTTIAKKYQDQLAQTEVQRKQAIVEANWLRDIQQKEDPAITALK